MASVNEPVYPGSANSPQFDGVGNFPSVNKVSTINEVTEAINRNRDTLLILERILGPVPHVGAFTEDENTATVAERVSILEEGMSSGRFRLSELNVDDKFIVQQNPSGNTKIFIGSFPDQVDIADIFVTGATFFESSAPGAKIRIRVPFTIDRTEESNDSTNIIIAGSSNSVQPLMSIQDFSFDKNTLSTTIDSYALRILGNVLIEGKLEADFAIDHRKLLNIGSTPTIDLRNNTVSSDEIHVARGDFHSHKKGRFDPALQRWIVDPSPQGVTTGIIDHIDLEGIETIPGQVGFIPDEQQAYHVTGGDTHDHTNGRGAQIDHNFLEPRSIDPKTSNHTTGGDNHAHTPTGDGATIDHNHLLDSSIDPSSSNHVTNGDNHGHTDSGDGGVIDHTDLLDSSIDPSSSNHVTNGDSHGHTDSGDGGVIDHTDLLDSSIDPSSSNHVTNGDNHEHNPTNGDGAQIDHDNLSNIGGDTTATRPHAHVQRGDDHQHDPELGDGGIISHDSLSEVESTTTALRPVAHVTGGDAHAHTPSGDGGVIDHGDLDNVGSRTHVQVDAVLDSLLISQPPTGFIAGYSYRTFHSTTTLIVQPGACVDETSSFIIRRNSSLSINIASVNTVLTSLAGGRIDSVDGSNPSINISPVTTRTSDVVQRIFAEMYYIYAVGKSTDPDDTTIVVSKDSALTTANATIIANGFDIIRRIGSLVTCRGWLISLNGQNGITRFQQPIHLAHTGSYDQVASRALPAHAIFTSSGMGNSTTFSLSNGATTLAGGDFMDAVDLRVRHRKDDFTHFLRIEATGNTVFGTPDNGITSSSNFFGHNSLSISGAVSDMVNTSWLGLTDLQSINVSSSGNAQGLSQIIWQVGYQERLFAFS